MSIRETDRCAVKSHDRVLKSCGHEGTQLIGVYMGRPQKHKKKKASCRSIGIIWHDLDKNLKYTNHTIHSPIKDVKVWKHVPGTQFSMGSAGHRRVFALVQGMTQLCHICFIKETADDINTFGHHSGCGHLSYRSP